MRLKTAVLIGSSAALLAAVPALAHHSYTMFDPDKLVTWEGTVAEYRWANPHVRLVVNVPNANRDVAAGDWDIEGASIAIMTRQGWNKSTFRAGDKITVVGHPLRSGGKGGSLFYALDKNGNKLFPDPDRTGKLGN